MRGEEERDGEGDGEGEGALINGRNCTSPTPIEPRLLMVYFSPDRRSTSPAGRMGEDLVKVNQEK